jgi:hypothetical protein
VRRRFIVHAVEFTTAFDCCCRLAACSGAAARPCTGRVGSLLVLFSIMWRLTFCRFNGTFLTGLTPTSRPSGDPVRPVPVAPRHGRAEGSRGPWKAPCKPTGEAVQECQAVESLHRRDKEQARHVTEKSRYSRVAFNTTTGPFTHNRLQSWHQCRAVAG